MKTINLFCHAVILITNFIKSKKELVKSASRTLSPTILNIVSAKPAHSLLVKDQQWKPGREKSYILRFCKDAASEK